MLGGGVTSLAEVWIEMVRIGRISPTRSVTSLAEVWIEITKHGFTLHL